jgi:chromosome segregation ATPase
VLVTYVHNGAISEAGRAQLQRIADLKSQDAEADRGLHDVDSQTASVTSDEERIRRNIASLNVVSGQQQQVQDYARQLATSEQQLAALRDRKAELQKKKSALEGEINKLIEALSF